MFQNWLEVPLTFYCDLVFACVGMSEDLHMNRHLSHSIIHPRACEEVED